MLSVSPSGAVACTCAACVAAASPTRDVTPASIQPLRTLGSVSKSTRAALRRAAGELFDPVTTAMPLTRSANGQLDHLRVTSLTPFTLDLAGLASTLRAAPLEFTTAAAERPVRLAIPKPDGSFARFDVVRSEVMEPGLAQQFPSIQTYRGVGIDDPTADIRLDTTPAGFHAQVLSPEGAYYVDPYFTNDALGAYASYFKADAVRGAAWNCLTLATGVQEATGHDDDALSLALADDEFTLPSITYGGTRKTYRAAVAGNRPYVVAATSGVPGGATVANGQAAIVTAMNRVSGVYETELSIRMTLVANNSTVVYGTDNPLADPYSNSSSAINQNTGNLNTRIGVANYDIGHVFTTASGGVAALGSVGKSNKGAGTTGTPSPVGDTFTIDYVAHEIGHQFGGNHTFNSSLDGNRNGATAYEPGSGSSIMAYAGLVGNDNTTNFSIPYFNHVSIDEIRNYIATIPSVGASTATGNNAPSVSPGLNYVIPTGTPFALTATGSDPDGDTVTYDWQERNLGGAKTLAAADNGSSPLFRQFAPSTSPTRTFPILASILRSTNNNLTANAAGSFTNPAERLPTVARAAMRFRVIARDGRAGGGGVSTADMQLQVVNTGAAFLLTNFNTAQSLQGGSTQTVTWDVAGTTGNGINAPTVDVLLSTNNGQTFTTLLADDVPNDGSQSFQLPFGVGASQARIKVQPTNNVFFDIGNANFTIVNVPVPTNSATPGVPALLAASDTGVSDADRITRRNNASAADVLQLSVANTVAGATVEVLADGVVIGSAIAGGTTTVVTTDGASALADGTRAFTARQTEPGRVASTSLTATNVTIDATAPAPATQLDLAAASDSGVSDADQLTNDATPTFALGSSDAYLRLTRDAVAVTGDYATDATFTDAALADGTFVYALSSVDAAGNVGAAITLAVTVDTLGPTLVEPTQFDFETEQAVRYAFGEDLVATIDAGDFAIARADDGTAVTPTLVYDPATRTATLRFGATLADGNYVATLGGLTDAAGNALAPDSLAFFVLAGDVNRDRTVSFPDLVSLAQNYGQTGRTFSSGNLDYSADGSVGFADLVILAQRYGTTLDPARPLFAAPTISPSAGRTVSSGRRGGIAADVLA